MSDFRACSLFALANNEYRLMMLEVMMFIPNIETVIEIPEQPGRVKCEGQTAIHNIRGSILQLFLLKIHLIFFVNKLKIN